MGLGYLGGFVNLATIIPLRSGRVDPSGLKEEVLGLRVWDKRKYRFKGRRHVGELKKLWRLLRMRR